MPTTELSKIAKTVLWLQHTWSDNAKPRFEKFMLLLDDADADIPEHYYDSTTHDGKGTNPTFRFLRPNSIKDIFVALNDPENAEKADEVLVTIIVPYISAWRELLAKIESKVRDKRTLSVVRNKFNRLCNESQIYGGDTDEIVHAVRNYNRPQKWIDLDACDRAYQDFCSAFAQLQLALPKKDGTVKKKKVRTLGYLTQEQVAKACGLAVMTIKRWEKGPDSRDTTSNKYGYYKSLRTNRDLYKALLEVIKKVRADTVDRKDRHEKSEATGIRTRRKGPTFVPLTDAWGEEFKDAIEDSYRP